ncbi:MAG: LPS export ABC transporter periplasmic protein LptC [Brevinema sp.]
MFKKIFIVFIIFLTSCGIKLGRNDRNKRELPAASIQDFLYAYTEKSGFREWEVKAAQAHTYENSSIIYLYNMTMTLFSESNQIKTVLVANKGSVQQDIGNLIAEGEVRIFSSNQSELQTEKVYWEQQRNLFYSETNKLVTYIRGTHKITGYDMVSDSQLENIELDNSVGQIETGTQNTEGEPIEDVTEFNEEFRITEEEVGDV